MNRSQKKIFINSLLVALSLTMVVVALIILTSCGGDNSGCSDKVCRIAVSNLSELIK